MYQLFTSFLLLILFVIFSSPLEATSLILSDVPESISVDDSFTVTASFSGSKSSCGSKTYFLRGVLFQNSGDDLFGSTKNTIDEWITVSELPSRLFSFTTSDEGTWGGQLSIKGDHTATGFKGQGIYQLRLDRYTQTGTSKAESSNATNITLLYSPPPTPTPAPTATPEPTSTPTPSPTLPVSLSPTPVPSTSMRPVASATSQSASFLPDSEHTSSDSAVLGAMNIGTKSAQPRIKSLSQTSSRLIPSLIVFGGLCIASGGISLGIALLEKKSVP